MDVNCSLITICNDRRITDGFIENLSTQAGVNYEYIQIDNFKGEYLSAREAYNQALDKLKGKYIIFLHPDIRFLDSLALRGLISYCDEIGDFGVVGAAGAKPDSKGNRVIYTHIINGVKKVNPGRDIAKPVEVQTVDECLFVVKKEALGGYPFPDSSGFHLYAAEYCLRMLVAGKKNYAVPVNAWHLSDGRSLDPSYLVQLEKLIRMYKAEIAVIYTTVKKWPTRGRVNYIYRKYYYLKQYMKKAIERV